MIRMGASNCLLPYGRGPDLLLGVMALGLLLGQHQWGYSQAGATEAMLPGLAATYSDDKHSVRLVAATPNFYLRPDESIHPSLATAFRAEWTGLLSVLQADDYTIECDSAEVLIAGQRVAARPVRLSVGRHPLVIKYIRRPGIATLRLQWKSALFLLEPIPSSLFFHSPAKTIARKDTLIERGRDLVEEFGCVNCHATGPGSLQGRLGPDLTAIGSRTDPRWLHKWLEDPSAFRSGAMMPGLFDRQQRSDIASYLASLGAGGSADPNKKPTRHDIAKDNPLFGVLGCAACRPE
ncbi:MAG: c-type cytochrome, partial [Acidobacteriota bacterium]